MEIRKVDFEVAEIISEKKFDQDDDNFNYSYWSELDTCKLEEIEVDQDEDLECSDPENISKVIIELANKGYLPKDSYSVEGDIIQFKVIDNNNDYQPILQITLQ